MTKIDCSLIQRLPCESGPEFKLVAVTMTAMTIVTTGCHVHREAPTILGRAVVQWTTSIPLIARLSGGLEPDHVEHLLHRDLGAKPIEVDSWHGFLSSRGETRIVPFPLSLWGTGNDPI